jgi:5-methyltetrahydrofolate corrinoid/iron sulfur protein methyltransferase
MLLAADNLHAMNPIVSDALRELDAGPIQELARACEQNGAQLIDLNPGYLSRRHEDRMAFLVEAVQEVTSARLILDSPNARVLARGLAVCRETPVLNALSLEDQKLQEILPLAAEHGTGLVLLLMDERSFTPPSTEEKMAIAAELRERCLGTGVKEENLIFDPVLPNLSWDDAYFRISEGLKTVRLLGSGAIFQYPVQTMVGLSNLRSGHLAGYPIEIEEVCLTLFAGAGLKIALANALRPELRAVLESISQMTGSDAD